MSQVEITIEFDEQPTKEQVYAYILDAIMHDTLRYDLDGQLDAQES